MEHYITYISERIKEFTIVQVLHRISQLNLYKIQIWYLASHCQVILIKLPETGIIISTWYELGYWLSVRALYINVYIMVMGRELVSALRVPISSFVDIMLDYFVRISWYTHGTC